MGCQVPFLQPYNSPAFSLPVRLNVRLNYRSNGGKGKKINVYLHCFDLLPFLPSFLTCRPDLSFFPLFLIPVIDLGGAVIFEILGSCGMGEGRADCTKSQCSSRLHTSLWKPISGIKSNRCGLRPVRHRKIGGWWIFTWAEVTSRQSHHRMYLCGWHRKIY